MAARNLVWTGAAGDGDFNNPANWEDAATAMAALTAPTGIDFVSFQGTTGGTIGGTGTAETLTIGGLTTWTFDGSVTLSGQPTAFTPVGLVVFTSTSFSGATINDSAASVQINETGATAVLTAENASTVTAAATFIGNDIDSSGSLVVTGVNTTWHDIYNASISTSGVMLVGQAGPSGMQPGSQGSLTVTDYAVVTEDSSAVIGVNAGSTGTATVSDHGNWNTGTIFYVGQGGDGSLTIETDGTVTDTGNAYIGEDNGGAGTVTVLGGGVWNVGSVLYVAASTGSTGDLDIEAGGTVALTAAAGSSNPVVIIGQGPATTSPAAPAAMGSVTVAGAGAKLDADDPIQLGGYAGGDASLTIDQGGSVSAATADSNVEFGMALANRTGVVATLTIGDTDPATTAQSQLSVAGGLIIGRGGTATANIDHGGTLLVTDAAANGSSITIGAGRGAGPNGPTYVGGSGTAIVTGGTIDLDSATAKITVGGYGVQGTLDVNTGGVVLSGAGLTVGAATMAGGVIYGGTGTVDIGAGGTVKVADASLPGTRVVVIGGANASLAGAAAPATSGTVTVSGSGALLDTNGGGLAVGDQTRGSLTISHGGAVYAGTVDIGVTANGPGAVDVEGDGDTSLLAATGALNVGVAAQGVLTVGAGGTVAVGGTITIGTSGTVIGAGTGGVIDPPSYYDNEGKTYGPLTIAATSAIDNTGTFIATGGMLELNGAVTGTGVLQVQGDGVLQLDQGVDATQTVELATTGATLAIKDPGGFTSTIAGYTSGDTVMVYGIAGQPAPDYSSADGNTTLTYANGVSLTFDGMFSSGQIDVQADTTPPPPPPVPCFLAGTRIATPYGETRVEDLSVGDVVRAHFAGPARVKWIGHRRVDCWRHPEPHKVWPVRIGAGAFGPDLPSRDLFLSPDHAVFADDALIPIKYLVNGTTVVQIALPSVTYYHVELDLHDVLLADGLPAESFLPTGNRAAFENGDGPMQMHPDFVNLAWDGLGCAPLVVTGAVFANLQARLQARACRIGRAAA